MADKAIFLDRDDTLIHDIGYINDPDQVRLIDGVAGALAEMSQMGFKLIVVSNQSAVARGIVTEQKLEEIHQRLTDLLAEQGAYLDGIYYCPFFADGLIKKYRKESDLRKPKPGMLLKAADEMDLDLMQSWMVGDRSIDIEAGLRAGCRTIMLQNSSAVRKPEEKIIEPHYYAVNMKEAANIIKRELNNPVRPPVIREDIADSLSDSYIQQPQDSPNSPQEQKSHETVQTHHLLKEILEQLRKNHRDGMFDEFSTMRMLAGIVQMGVLLCFLIAIWFLMSPQDKSEAVILSLAFAAVLQLMALTFYMMREKK